MIDRAHDLPITKQAEVLCISRSSIYYLPRPVPEVDLAIMRRLDRLHLEFPFAGVRIASLFSLFSFAIFLDPDCRGPGRHLPHPRRALRKLYEAGAGHNRPPDAHSGPRA